MASAPPITTTLPPLTRKSVFNQSWPIMLANALAPVVGLVDTFVIGRFNTTTALAGIGLGAVIYGIAYWGFGFLRMSTAGLTAQSDGAGDEASVQAHLFRALPLGLIIGLLVFITQALLLAAAFKIFTASEVIEHSAATYISARLWGLPATLASIALMGWFVGISRSGRALSMQIVLNIINLILSPLFVISFGWGLYGVGIASAIAEWGGLAAGLWLARAEIIKRGGFRPINKAALLDPAALSKLGVTNGNIFIRTMALTVGFSFFGNAAAGQGEVFLAGNHILMQFITITALVLDAFAHTAEAVTGAAYGAKDKPRFKRAVRLTTEFSAMFAALCGGLIYFGGPYLIAFLSKDPAVQDSAGTFLIYCALAPILGFAAWELDGIFIGTTRSKEMRNAGVLAVALYLITHYSLLRIFPDIVAGHIIWTAFILWYIARAATLAVYYPRVVKAME